MKSGCASARRARLGRETGFSLIEVLLAAVVLAIFTLLMLRLFDATRVTSVFWGQRMDAETQARIVLDRLAQDFARMIRRPDVDVAIGRAAGNDRIRFFSQVEGFSDAVSPSEARGISVVEYRINEDGKLERGARALPFAGLVFSPPPDTSSEDVPVRLLDGPDNLVPAVNQGASGSNFDVLGDQVLRFELGYILKKNLAANPPRPAPELAAELPPGTQVDEIAAIFVGIVTLDQRARVLLNEAQLGAMRDAFRDYTQADAAARRDILAVWSRVLQDGALLQIPGMPQPSAQAARVYQRVFPLP
jgi:hypothetical protein